MRETKRMELRSSLAELGKSMLPAGLAEEGAYYPFYCSSPEPKAISRWIVDGEAIVMGTGGVATVHHGHGQFAYSTDCWAFASRNPELTTEYLYRLLQYRLPRIDYAGFEGSGLRHLRKDFIRDLCPDVPEIPVQRRLTEILGAVDEAIAQTEALIAKTQQIKAGLMHDLFTRGVTSDGRLRPARDDAPQLYNESPFGWLPTEWEWCRVVDLLASSSCPMRSGPFGSALLKEELVEDGIPLLGIDNVFTERFVPDYRRFVPPQKFLELNRYAVFPGDVIITIMGTVGRCCVVPDGIGRALSSKHLWTMTFDGTRVLPELVCWQLNHAAWARSWFLRHAQGGIMEAIQSSTLRELRLPVPSMGEQERIRDRYCALQEKLASEQAGLVELRQRKRGLMHDLLTGFVRMRVVEPEAESVYV